MTTERSNEEWRKDLAEPGPAQEAALADLREIILKGLPYGLSTWLSPSDPQFDSLTEETVQETLLRVLSHLNTFEGRSKFTTWVYKIAIRIALTELRRKRWQDVSLESLLDRDAAVESSELIADTSPGPDLAAEQSDLLAKVKRIILEGLTEKQRTAFIAIRIKGMPIEEVARQMGTNRNALYKLMHDARLRLKRRMAEEGLTPEEVLTAFEAE